MSRAPVKVITEKLCDLFYEVRARRAETDVVNITAVTAPASASAILVHTGREKTLKKTGK